MKESPADAGAGYDAFEVLGNITDRGKEQRFVEDIKRICEQRTRGDQVMMRMALFRRPTAGS